ncbi:MAG: hypothetical protein KDJ16_12905, partial [Hyphomicrobiales bacterium]|nr:hypothetical protein [Hyphomicrobiales bacterium]
NVAGAVLKQFSLGTLLNSVVGIVGGGLGGQIPSLLLGAGSGGNGSDIGSIISQIAGGGVGGGVLMVIVGVIKKALAK